MPLTAASQASFPWLSLIVLLPAAGSLVIPLLPGEEDSDSNLPRNIALSFLLADFIIIIGVIGTLLNSQISEKWLQGKSPSRIIYEPKKLINLVL